jgi:hypothetical protein
MRTERLQLKCSSAERRLFEAAADADERTLSDWLRLAAKKAASGRGDLRSDAWSEKVRHETPAAIARDSRRGNRTV